MCCTTPAKVHNKGGEGVGQSAEWGPDDWLRPWGLELVHPGRHFHLYTLTHHHHSRHNHDHPHYHHCKVHPTLQQLAFMVQYSFESHPQTTSSAQLWESFIMSQLYWDKIGNANKMTTASMGETPKLRGFLQASIWWTRFYRRSLFSVLGVLCFKAPQKPEVNALKVLEPWYFNWSKTQRCPKDRGNSNVGMLSNYLKLGITCPHINISAESEDF